MLSESSGLARALYSKDNFPAKLLYFFAMREKMESHRDTEFMRVYRIN